MPTLQENTIGQKLTTSNQGSNKMPKLDAKSYFFLEDETFTQDAAKSFGVISEDEFRTTSLINVVNKKVISICSGQIFIQPQTGSIGSKVNLILKPYRQPISGISIKYFIYRGLPFSDFFDANKKVLATGSGLITHIRNEYDNFYAQDSGTPPDFEGKFIGYPDDNAPVGEAQEDSDLIDSYFYKLSQTFDDEIGPITNSKRAFELPMVPAGTHLATASGEIGLEIVLNEGDYFIENDTNPFQLNLAFARLAEHKLDAAAIADVYQKKVLREAVTLFIDPAAYYGLHANGGSITKFGLTTPINTPANIYSLITPFVSKNTIYLYIQSNRQRSYNFYQNYKISDTNPKNIKIGTAEANLVETEFETNKWPLSVFTTAPAAGSTQQTIALQFTTDARPNTSLFGVLANIISPNQENFIDPKDLITKSGANGAVYDFTQTVVIGSPVSNDVNIASFVQMIYLGKEIVLSKPGIDDGDPNTPPPDPIFFSPKYMDDVFYLTDAVSFLEADNVYHVHSYKPTLYNQQSIDKKRKRVISFTQRTQNTIAISDTQNLTLYTYLSIVENDQSQHSNFEQNPSSNKESVGYGIQKKIRLHDLSNLFNNEIVILGTFLDNLVTITSIILDTTDNSLPTSLGLGITESQNNILKSLSNNHQNIKLFFSLLNSGKNPSFTNIQGADLIESNKITNKFSLGILIDKNDFKQELVFPQTPDAINVYSTDGLFFYSKEYSDHIQQEYSFTDDMQLLKTDLIVS